MSIHDRLDAIERAAKAAETAALAAHQAIRDEAAARTLDFARFDTRCAKRCSVARAVASGFSVLSGGLAGLLAGIFGAGKAGGG